MLLSRSGEILDSPAFRLAARPPQTNAVNVPLWTDDFASLFQILRTEGGPQIDPQFEEARNKAAYSLGQQGDFAGAIACYRLALKTHPRSPVLLNNLAFLLATCPDTSQRNGPEAVRLAEKACQLTHYRTPLLVGTLAAAYAETGRFDDAIWMALKASALASESGDQVLLQRNQELLELYRVHKPYQDPTEKLVPAAQ
jgi:tetratricopeptide (TPR) repeat protein